MTKSHSQIKLQVDGAGYVGCPNCRKPKIHHLLPSSTGRNILIFCPRCKREMVVDIIENAVYMKSPERKTPEA